MMLQQQDGGNLDPELVKIWKNDVKKKRHELFHHSIKANERKVTKIELIKLFIPGIDNNQVTYDDISRSELRVQLDYLKTDEEEFELFICYDAMSIELTVIDYTESEPERHTLYEAEFDYSDETIDSVSNALNNQIEEYLENQIKYHKHRLEQLKQSLHNCAKNFYTDEKMKEIAGEI